MDSVIEITRAAELKLLEQILDTKGPDIIGLYGIAGIGKSMLVNSLVKRHPDCCIKINCQLIEPTPHAFIKQLQTLVNSQADLSLLRDDISPGTILVLDQFESFTLMESWLRRDFIPAMNGQLKLVFSGRLHPDMQWVINPPDNTEFRALKLSSLSFNSALHYLEHQGHSHSKAVSINHFANGHPLAMQLASSAVRAQPERCLSDAPPNEVIQILVHYFAEDIKEPVLRQALEATSVVRRINESILSEMLKLDSCTSEELFERLRKIDFIEHREDGLSLHEVLKNVLSANLKARYPDGYGIYRDRACRILLREMQTAPASQLWRYTADILYLVENPVIRSAFFPPDDVREYSVEPAREADKASVMGIVALHEPVNSLDIYECWWQQQINVFHCVKNSENRVVGFYCLIKPDEVPPTLLRSDPVTDAWCKHVKVNNNDKPGQNLFIRRWLSHEEGESAGGVQAACWLDIKRTYLEMRPKLRNVYLTLCDLKPYAPVAVELGFQVLGTEIDINGQRYYTAMLDMGAGSVDGWISKRLLNEIRQDAETMDYPSWFDLKARQVNLHGNRVDLTPLEFGTLELLMNNQGIAVSRKELLRKVWDIDYEGSSNVVDTIVRSLRKKLYEQSSAIQSVRGVGYRYMKSS
ncbi:winged helix-turn-helix domain-containing protein [Vibrio albus]|uniref:winged helix-turn-helix domain-containing protein n=1 Tax=Vibrio albus TaxID=2200953 RepID=UPI001FE547C6|nr:winged helix-turn-helix domain-containing protein [Vibrio albus]